MIKKGNERTTWRVRHHLEFVYAKVFAEPRNAVLRLCAWGLLIHPAIREWRALRRLEESGVPAVHPIALLRVEAVARKAPSAGNRRGSHLLLLTRELPESRNLLDAWNDLISLSGVSRLRETRRLISAVSALWALGHQSGYAHPDAHPGNVLIQQSSDPQNRFAAAFADAVAPWFSPMRAKPVRQSKALRSLAALDHYFHRVASRTDRLRFWRQYWMNRNVLLTATTERCLLAVLWRHKIIHHATLARRRDRRLGGDGKYYSRIKLPGGWHALVALALERRHVYAEPNAHDLTSNQWEEILAAATANPQSWASPNLRLLRRPATVRGPWAAGLFFHTHRLRHRDIPAPLILGYLQRTRAARVLDEYLILPRRS